MFGYLIYNGGDTWGESGNFRRQFLVGGSCCEIFVYLCKDVLYLLNYVKMHCIVYVAEYLFNYIKVCSYFTLPS